MTAIDAEIINLLKSIDDRQVRRGYQLLVQQYARNLTVYIRDRRPTDAIKAVEDIRMETLTIFVINVQQGKFREEASIKTYLLRVAKNLCFKEYKAEKKLDLDALMRRIYSSQTELPPSEKATEQLSGALKKLSAKCQEMIRLYYWRGWSQKEIAQELTTKEQAVKQQLYRCKEKLKNFLGIR